MKQYLISVFNPEGESLPPEVSAKRMQDIDALNQEMQDAGARVFAGGLYPSSTATVVRLHEGELLTTDGPFTEGKEHIAGFWIINAADLDSALEWGRKATRACAVPIEVRAFHEAED